MPINEKRGGKDRFESLWNTLYSLQASFLIERDFTSHCKPMLTEFVQIIPFSLFIK